MLPPPPTQPPIMRPVPTTPTPVPQPKKRPGEALPALFIKDILRPFIKLLYYIITGIKKHKLLTLAAVLLLLVSIFGTTYATTAQWPLDIGNDPFNFHIRGGDGGGGQVKNWLYALRDGDVTYLQLLDRQMAQPPDVNQLTERFSQSKSHLAWKSINTIGTYAEADTTVDSFIRVELSANGPGGTTSGVTLWHFVTASANSQNLLLAASLVDAR